MPPAAGLAIMREEIGRHLSAEFVDAMADTLA